MIRYAAFRDVVATLGDDRLAALATYAGVPVDVWVALAAGDVAGSTADRYQIGDALGMNPLDLFRLPPPLEDERRSHSTLYEVRPDVLRAVDRARAS